MKSTDLFIKLCCLGVVALGAGCKEPAKTDLPVTPKSQPAPNYFKVDAAHSGSIGGTIRFTGKRPAAKLIDMSEDPACVEAHKGKVYDESLVVSPGGLVANAFIYIDKGLEGKTFEVPVTPVIIDQKGCWFRPRVLGIQVGQVLQVVNSDPVTHNIHPMAEINREWNHSQGPGDDPLSRKFLKPEVMIPVKCNIHSWMHAFIGVRDDPYFAVTPQDGSFTIANLPPGTYTLAVWQEKLGTQKQEITVTEGHNTVANITFKGQ
jgi:plastocyanin